MKKWVYCALCLATLASCFKEPEALVTDSECVAAERVQNNHQQVEALELLMDKGSEAGIPGISLMVYSESQGNYTATRGYAELDQYTKLQPCHVFRAASLTKTVLATVVIQLMEEGKLKIDDPITALLPKTVWEGLARADETTIAELMNHTSGIPNYDDNTRFVAAILNEPGKELTADDRLDFAKELQGTQDWVIEKFGTIYSNTNYVLLELIVEQVMGRPFEEVVDDYIFKPIQMEHSSFGTINPFPNGLCTGYCDMYDKGNLREVNLYDARRWSGEAAMISNGNDIYAFFRALLDAEFCSQTSFELMKKEQYGLLQDTIAGIPAIGHDGQAIGYSSEMWYFEELGLTIVLMANQGRISGDQPSIQPFEELLEQVVLLHQH